MKVAPVSLVLSIAFTLIFLIWCYNENLLSTDGIIFDINFVKFYAPIAQLDRATPF